MRLVVRHVLVLVISFALVASAAAWRQCTGLKQAAAAAAMGHSSDVASHRAPTLSHGEHGHHAMSVQHAADESSGPPAIDDHGCTKCCAICALASALPPAWSTAVIFTVSSRMYPRGPETWTANTVAVDPGIPKRIV